MLFYGRSLSLLLSCQISNLIEFAASKSPLWGPALLPSSVFICQAPINLKRFTMNTLATINQSISNTSCSSPLLVVGDLNCHLGQAGGPRSSAEPNHRGMQWKDLIDSHSLYVPSLSHLATGPVDTFSSGPNSTTLDYIIGNFATSTVMVACTVEEEHPLNTSDHLPISKLKLSLLTTVSTASNHIALDWTSAIRDGCISQYASLTDQAVTQRLLLHGGDRSRHLPRF